MITIIALRLQVVKVQLGNHLLLYNKLAEHKCPLIDDSSSSHKSHVYKEKIENKYSLGLAHMFKEKIKHSYRMFKEKMFKEKLEMMYKDHSSHMFEM